MSTTKSTLERDKQILDIVSKTYNFQFELGERLDNKLNNFNAVNGTIATLSVGIAIFIFERISIANPVFVPLLITFFAFFGFFISAIFVGLRAYKPSDLEWYPSDPQKLIEVYSTYSDELAVIHTVAASLALATKSNLERNARKARSCSYVFFLFSLGIAVLVVFTVLMLIALRIPSPTSSNLTYLLT